MDATTGGVSRAGYLEGANVAQEQEILWERWACERLVYLESIIRQGRSGEDEVIEADRLRAGFAARANA